MNATPNSTVLDRATLGQKQQASTIVRLTTQGQMLSSAHMPGSIGEQNETVIKEAGESSYVQFMEGEGGGRKGATINAYA